MARIFTLLKERRGLKEDKKIEQLKKRIDKVFDKITTDEIEQRIKEDKLLDEEMELMTENKKIEQLKKRIYKVFDKITTDEI